MTFPPKAKIIGCPRKHKDYYRFGVQIGRDVRVPYIRYYFLDEIVWIGKGARVQLSDRLLEVIRQLCIKSFAKRIEQAVKQAETKSQRRLEYAAGYVEREVEQEQLREEFRKKVAALKEQRGEDERKIG